MKLTKIALLAVKGCGSAIIKRLASALFISESHVYKLIRENSDDLTKAAALEVIREETGLTDDEILEKRLATAAT